VQEFSRKRIDRPVRTRSESFPFDLGVTERISIVASLTRRSDEFDKRYILCRKYLRFPTSCVNLSNQMDRSLDDLTGRTFGKWIVLPRGGFESNYRNGNWLVQCECGRLRHIAGEDLLNGRSSSCGCVSRGKNGNNGKTSARGAALRTRLHRVMNGLRPQGTAPLSEGAWESGLVDQDTQSDFWFD
jgi:hypothetical protein